MKQPTLTRQEQHISKADPQSKQKPSADQFVPCSPYPGGRRPPSWDQLTLGAHARSISQQRA